MSLAQHKGTGTARGSTELDTLLPEGAEELGHVTAGHRHPLPAPTQPVPHGAGALHSISDLSLPHPGATSH